MSANDSPPQAGDGKLFGYPPTPSQPVPGARSNLGRGVVVGVLAAIVAALAYGVLLRALAHDDGSTTELGYGPLAVGALVGVAAGRAGGRAVELRVAAPFIAVLGVILGQLFGAALIESHLAARLGVSLPVTDVLFHHFGALCREWKHSFGVKRFVVLWFAALTALGLARYFGER
jgi:hypothetical protein